MSLNLSFARVNERNINTLIACSVAYLDYDFVDFLNIFFEGLLFH